MQTLKPDDVIVKSLTALFIDAGNQFSFTCKDQARSTKYLVNRYKSEGLGFVTKTLPAFGKHFDKCLKAGQYTLFHGFKTHRKGNFPSVLRGVLLHVFGHNGTLLDEPDIESIRFVRQLAFMFYKLEGEYPEELVNESIRDFVRTDELLARHIDGSVQFSAVINVAQDVIQTIFKDLDVEANLTPRPGPGQNASSVDRELLYEPLVKYTKIHALLPYYRYFYLGTEHLLDRVRKYKSLPVQHESVSKLTCVPKDSRGPRIICMEPPEFMWLQQGVSREMVKHLERHPLTAGQVNFTDQSVNGNLALEASVSQKWATLDMKEASDRISRDLVSCLFDGVPRLRDILLSLSTDIILTPLGALRKKKYAPMGSALCFPVMSVVHFALSVGAIAANTKRSPTRIAKEVYVYGDDLIVRTDDAEFLLSEFPHYGLMFNADKCCRTGYFRESCGVDAFKGHVITPCRVKTLCCRKTDGSSIVSNLAKFHNFFNKGYWNTARIFQQLIEDACGDLPRVSKNTSALGWIVPKDLVWEANRKDAFKYDPDLQTLTKRVRVITAATDKKKIGGWERLMRSLTSATKGDGSRFSERSNVVMRWKVVPLSSL